MARAPLLVPALAFVAAIAADAYGFAALAAIVALGTATHRRARIAGAFALAGLLCAAWRGHPPQIVRETRTASWSGTVTGDVARSGDGARFPLTLSDGIAVRAQVPQRVAPGERLVVRGRLVPFDEARNAGEPSPRALARAEGLAGELHGSVVARAPPDPRDARAWGPRLRAALGARLRLALREPEASVVAGALWGERGALPAPVRDAFQATGTVHVLVTAGLHLGVVAAFTLGLLRLARVPRIAASLVAIAVVAAYAWLSGGHLPSERAAAMVSIALLARACGARAVSWNAFALAALVVATLRPAAVTSVSFALSFSCVAAIVLFARPLERGLQRVCLPERVREALALTVATQIGVWPLSAATFGLVAPYAVAANAVVVPATAVAMLGGIATLAAAGVPVLARAAAALTAFAVDAILGTVGLVAALPGARLAVAPPPALAIVAYDAVALVAAATLRRSARWAIALLAAGSAGVLATTLRLPDGRLTIAMLDVGQADAIVIRTPRGRTLLIDSGGRLERGPSEDGLSPAEALATRVVLPYLRREAIGEVALLVNTHPHGDHVGGFPVLVDHLRVDAVADSGQRYGGHAFNDGLREAALHHVPIRVARCGDRWESGDGVSLQVLSPCGALLRDGRNDVNENSVVVMLRYGGFRMLFMGDAGFETERRLLARGLDLRADVLKIGHHGSAYASSAAFVAAVRPRLALVSVGRHNAFGHPAPATIATLEERGASVYRTDRCGGVTLVATAAALTGATMIDCTVSPKSRTGAAMGYADAISRRARLRRYIASSAARSTTPGVVPASGTSAIPMLAPTRMVRSASTMGCSSAARSRSATAEAAGSSIRQRIAPNSSPPSRATASSGRSSARSRPPHARSTRSPTA